MYYVFGDFRWVLGIALMIYRVLFYSQAEKGHRSGVRRETICVANAIRRQRLGCLETDLKKNECYIIQVQSGVQRLFYD
jgi:hypothetical protein